MEPLSMWSVIDQTSYMAHDCPNQEMSCAFLLIHHNVSALWSHDGLISYWGSKQNAR